MAAKSSFSFSNICGHNVPEKHNGYAVIVSKKAVNYKPLMLVREDMYNEGDKMKAGDKK